MIHYTSDQINQIISSDLELDKRHEEYMKLPMFRLNYIIVMLDSIRKNYLPLHKLIH